MKVLCGGSQEMMMITRSSHENGKKGRRPNLQMHSTNAKWIVRSSASKFMDMKINRNHFSSSVSAMIFLIRVRATYHHSAITNSRINLLSFPSIIISRVYDRFHQMFGTERRWRESVSVPLRKNEGGPWADWVTLDLMRYAIWLNTRYAVCTRSNRSCSMIFKKCCRCFWKYHFLTSVLFQGGVSNDHYATIVELVPL